ncbi:MAG: ATP-binding protein [Candidatus Paceibacterota bacterium]
MEDISFGYFSITLLIGAFTAFLSGLIVFMHDKKRFENKSWFYLNVASGTWSLFYFWMISTTNQSIALMANWILHVAAICIPLFYLIFALAITNEYEKYKKLLYLSFGFCIFFLLTNNTTLFVNDVIPKYPFNFAPDAGPLYIYFAFYFFLLATIALFIEAKAFFTTKDKVQKKRLALIILFTIFGYGGGGSVFLLTFNIPFPPYPLILFAIYPAISGYAIFRYQLFDLKVVTTQLFTFILWIIILIRTLLSDGIKDFILNLSLLLITILIGLLLIRSVIKEIKDREYIFNLATNLSKANAKLRALDRQKSEFLSIASHQIRGPLASIKGYASLLLEGSFGKVGPKAKEAVERIYSSSHNLVLVVNDFLDVSRIDQNNMKLSPEVLDWRKVIQETIDELRPSVEKKELKISFSTDKKINYFVYADKGKLKQIISNLIDNSVKYTPKGKISVLLEKKKDVLRMTVSDTGIGMSEETIDLLFEKFSRAKDAGKVNIMGTGLGLYVVKQLAIMQKGKVWAESDGEGEGSRFIVEFPIHTSAKASAKY